MLHPDYYPHIFDTIAANSSRPALLALRRVSRSAAGCADAALFADATLLLDWEGRVTLHASAGPRLADLRHIGTPFEVARLARVLAHITHLTLGGAWEFGCVPSLPTVSALINRMCALKRITLMPDPYGRRWRGRGGLELDLEGEGGCSVRCIPRPPTPPLSSPYAKSAADTSDLVIRTHTASSFERDILAVLGRAVTVTVVLSFWGPGWTTSPADRNAAVAARSHKVLVRWRYACAAAFVAGALEPSLFMDRKSKGKGKSTERQHRNVTIVGLEQVHPAYLDHEWMPDYETLACFRDRVHGVLERARESAPVAKEDEDDEALVPHRRGSDSEESTRGRGRRGRSRGPGRLYRVDESSELHGLATPEPETRAADTEMEVEADNTEMESDMLAPSASGLDPAYFADVVDRLRDYAASRSPSPAARTARSTSRARLAVPSPSPSPPPSRSRAASTPPSSASRSASRTPGDLYTRLSFVTQFQYALIDAERPAPHGSLA